MLILRNQNIGVQKKKKKKGFPTYKRFDEGNCDAEASLMNKDKMVVLLD